MTDPGDAYAKPLVQTVGVTGHRDPHPEALPALRSEVVRAFERLEAEFGRPIVVLSSLAEGADRLVAEITLQRGHRLVAPLPLPVEDYEKDFADDGSRGEFRGLLARAERSFVVAPLADEDATTMQDRDAAYRRAGVLVARDCHLLLALWDGLDTGKPGGTWDIVGVKRAAGGGVVHIHTPRATEVRPGTVATRWPRAISSGSRAAL
jgi:hypothetical protein